MPRKTPPPSPGRDEPAATEELCLMGPRQLEDLLALVESFGAVHAGPSRAAVAQRWRRAAAQYARLAVSEAGAADQPGIEPLPKSMVAHVARLVEQGGVRRTFDTVPVAFGLVELDKLIVSQYSLTRAVVERIRAEHALPLAPRRLAELCLPRRPIAADFRLAGRRDREFVFVSDAHDLRFLDAQVVDPVRVQGLGTMGWPRAVVALSVGFSANLLNAVRYQGRVALNNGHHRAYALRAMGLTHAPCLIQPCASMEDLEQAATQEICTHADLYFESPRPPLLRDFDHPALAHAFRAPRMRRQLTLKVDVQSRLLAL